MTSEPNEIPIPEPEIAPETTTREAAAEMPHDNSADEDSVLDRLLGIDAPEPRREVPPSDATAPDPEFDRALKALRRDGVPDDVLQAASKDPSKLKEWGLKAAKRQADVDKFGAEVAESRKKSQEPEAAKKQPKSEPVASSTTDDGEADADPLSEFSSIFGDDAAKPLRAMTDKLRSEFDERTRIMEVKYETKLAYQRLAGEYGRSAPSYDEIAETAAMIGRENPGAFESVSDIVHEAFRRRAGEPKRVDPRNVAKPVIGKPPARAVRELDKEDAVLDVLLSGGTRQDAMRVISR
jgi:hypothetical protein